MENIRIQQSSLISALISIDRPKVKEILSRPHSEQDPYLMVDDLVVPALEVIGAGWESGLYSLSQVYMSGRICEEILTELILLSDHPPHRIQPKIAIVVLEDYHLLGGRIVYSMLRSSGFELINYDRMDVDELVKQVLEDQIKILLISVLMLPSALRVKDLKEKLIKEKADVKLVVGGAPFRFDSQLWIEVGADAFGKSAVEAIDIVNQFIKETA